MEVNTNKTVIVIFNPTIVQQTSVFLYRGILIKIEDGARYLGTEYYGTKKFHQPRMKKVEAAVKESYLIKSKTINNHFMHTLIIQEYFDHCVRPNFCMHVLYGPWDVLWMAGLSWKECSWTSTSSTLHH